MIEITVEKSMATAVTPTRRVCEVAAMFGLGVDAQREIRIVPRATLRLAPAQVIFITGASGGGKTTLLRLLAAALASRDDGRVIDFAAADDAADEPLVESLGDTLEEAVRYLSLAGLNDAFVMLRRPRELSDGQRYRLRLAQSMREAERASPAALTVVLADEFGATLDRTTAQIIARNVRKWTVRSGVCFVAATTHDDLLEALEPDVLVVQHPGEAMQVLTRTETP